MWVSLWNYDRFGRNEFLGEVRIPLGDYKGFDEHPKWYTLSEMVSKWQQVNYNEKINYTFKNFN